LPRTIPVFILIDNSLLREALVRLIGKRADLSIVGEALAAEDSYLEIERVRPRVVLFDWSLPPLLSLELVRRISGREPRAGVLLMGMDDDEEVFMNCIRAGVSGYLLKSASAADVVSGIRAVANDEAVCPPRLLHVLFEQVAGGSRVTVPKPRIFLSYVMKDKELARELAAKISKQEFEVWSSDQAVLLGDNISLETARALEQSRAMVVLLSPDAVKSKQVLSEVDFALGSQNYRGRVIPVMLRPTEDIPWILRKFQIIRSTQDLDEVVREIIKALSRHEPREERLTTREQEVVALVAQGLANKDIGRRLGLSERTVKQHIHRILEKVGSGESARAEWLPLLRETGAQS